MTSMNMNKLSIILFLAASFVLTSCFEDESSLATRPLSEITIEEGSVSEVYNIGKDEVLTITPRIKQSNEQKALSYTWEIELEAYSHDKEFVYVGDKLGSYKCRLIVENEDGKTFFPFVLNVNSPYEEGVTVISKDSEGKSYLAFMLTPTDPNVKPKFIEGDCFAVNNPDMTLASNPTDIVQTSSFLLISCKGVDGSSTDIPSVYYLNEKTLVVENVVTAPEYADFKPNKLVLPSNTSQGISYPVLCENDRAYELSVSEGAVISPIKLPYRYSQSCVINDGTYYDFLFWDKDINALCHIDTGYGPYYCNKTYHATRDSMSVDNYFRGKTFVSMVLIQRTKKQMSATNPEAIIFTQTGPQFEKVILSTSLFVYDAASGGNVFYDNGGIKSCGRMNMIKYPVDAKTPCVANKTYRSMLYGKGNKVVRWYYDQDMTKADVLLTVGSDNAVITGFELSDDHKKAYVAFYEPKQEGLNGSVWVFDTDKGTVLDKHDNVCYQPVKIMYKKK